MATYSIKQIEQDEAIQVERNPWVDNLLRPALIIAMIMCLNVAVVNLVWLANPEWNGTYFLAAMLLTTIEGIYSYRVLNHYRSRGISVLRYRLVELGVLVLLLKLLTLLGKPWPVIQAELWQIWANPEAFMTTEFYVVLSLALAAWAASTFTMADIEALYDPYRDNRSALDSLTERYFWGGGLLLVLSGLTRWIAYAGLDSLVDVYRPSLGGVVFNVLIYFMLGLVLLSQINMTRLLVRWRVQQIQVSAGLAGQWVKYGLIFLGLVTLVAFALPTYYTLGLLETVGYVLNFIITIFVFILQLLMILLSLPVVLLMQWLGYNPTLPSFDSTPLPALTPPTGDSSWPPWLELLRSLMFWLVAGAAIIYLLKSYLKDHPGLVAHLRGFKPIALLLAALRYLWRRLTAWSGRTPALPNFSLKPSSHRLSTLLDTRLNFRKLSPRAKILQYYLNVLRFTERRGRGRKESETPYEYEPNLSDIAPSAKQDIKELTDTFVHARYSKADFSPEEAKAVKERWLAVKKSLRQDSS